jgi:CRISPR-associated endonuclease Cas2
VKYRVARLLGLIAYDIRHSRRLRRVAKIMENYGMRVQKSIFGHSVDAELFQPLLVL